MRLGGQPQRAHHTQGTGQRWESERRWSASQTLCLVVTWQDPPRWPSGHLWMGVLGS